MQQTPDLHPELNYTSPTDLTHIFLKRLPWDAKRTHEFSTISDKDMLYLVNMLNLFTFTLLSKVCQE